MKGTVSFADVGQSKQQRLNRDMQEVVERTECWRGAHQHGRDPSQYGNMFHFEDFSEKGTTKIQTYQRAQPSYSSEFANGMNESRRFTTPERSLPMNNFPDTAKSGDMPSAARASGYNASYRQQNLGLASG